MIMVAVSQILTEPQRARVRSLLRPSVIHSSAARSSQRTALMRFEAFAQDWLDRRRDEGLRCSSGYRSLLNTHLLPWFGDKTLGEIRTKTVRDFLLELRRKRHARRGTRLSERTKRNAFALVRTILNEAVADEIIEYNPCKNIRRTDLPRNKDADPSWRPGALFDLPEIRILCTDERIPLQRRMFFYLAFYTWQRQSELAAVRWIDYAPNLKPLGSITFAWAYSSSERVIRSPKPEEARVVPVHPKLEAALERWYCGGWEQTYGRAPRANDLIVPVLRKNGDLAPVRNDRAIRWLHAACRKVQIRERGFHSARASGLTAAEAAGARRAVLQSFTHASSDGNRAYAGYIRFPFSVQCRAMLRFDADSD